MCGIAGFYQAKFDYRKEMHWSMRLHKIRDSLLRRGPDDNHIFLSAHCGLAHTRLSVIDPSGGAQPMEKAGVSVSYNGELYNGRELREELKSFSIV